MKLGIRSKLIGFTFCVVLLVGGSISLGSILHSRARILRTFGDQCRATAAILARDLANDLYFLDVASLQARLRRARVVTGLVSAAVMDDKGEILATAVLGDPRRGERPADPFSAELFSSGRWLSGIEGGTLRVAGPVAMPDGSQIGFLSLGFALDDVDRAIRETVRSGLYVTAICLGIGAFLAFVFSRSFTNPIRVLVRATEAIRRGDLQARVAWDRRDELGALGDSINQMAASLEQKTVSKEYVDQILQSMADTLVVVDEKDRIRTVNAATETLLGYQAGELVGKPIDVVLADGWRGVGGKGGGGSVRNVEVTYRSKEGAAVPMSFSRSVMRDRAGGALGAVCVARDVRERRRAEQALKASEERFRSIFEKAGAGMILLTPEGRFLRANGAYCTLLGYSESDLRSRTVADVTHPDDLERTRQSLEEVLAGRQRFFEMEKRYVRKDGEVVWVHLTATWFSGPEGKPTYGVVMVQDVTERRRAQEELQKARDAALESARLKSEFLANMSHEIRTPMNGILGFVDLLERTSLDAVQRQYVEVVRLSADGLLTILNDILDFSKIEAGRLDFEMGEFDLRGLVEGVGDLLAPSAQEKGLEFVCGVIPEKAIRLRGDPTRLRQVLLNLVGNAVKFTERGEVALLAEVEETIAGNAEVVFLVRDTGVGIAPESRERLFQPFSQVDGSSTRRYGGTGLGLAISKRLAEQMGGRIGLESEPGKGTTFILTLPLEQAGGPPPPAAPSGLEGRRVLVVDDNPTGRALLERILRSFGCEPSAVPSGEEARLALREAERSGRPFDLALVDLRGIGEGGDDRAGAGLDEAPPAMPVRIGMCPVRSAESAHARGGGFAAVVTKPVKPSALRSAIAAALGQETGREAEGAPRVSPAEADEGERTSEAPGRRGGRVLVVEDEPVNQKVALALLARAGFEVDLARDGQEAVEAVGKGRYDLVLMDVQMPGMDGYEATAAIRAREAQGRRTPIVAMTARAMKGDRERCLEAGMDDYLTKPIRARDLYRMAEKWGAREPVESGAEGPAESEEYPGIVENLRALGVLTDPEAVGELVRLFLDSAAQTLSELKEACLRGDAKECAGLAHRLAGAALAFGAGKIGEEALRIEEAAGRSDLDGVGPLLEGMEGELARVRDFALRLAPLPQTP